MPEDEIDEKQALLPPDEQSPFKGAVGMAADQIRERAEDFYSVYANNMAVGFSIWDMHVIFGDIIGQREGKPVIEEFVKVTMTREVAKVFSHIMAANIVRYEEQFGEIQVPSVQLSEVPIQQAPLKERA